MIHYCLANDPMINGTASGSNGVLERRETAPSNRDVKWIRDSPERRALMGMLT
ncbi:MAG: hypothetical protein J6B91_09170 [Prevotella sp.]|nr:hypothetical protein [Prevotella sp.]